MIYYSNILFKIHCFSKEISDIYLIFIEDL